MTLNEFILFALACGISLVSLLLLAAFVAHTFDLSLEVEDDEEELDVPVWVRDRAA